MGQFFHFFEKIQKIIFLVELFNIFGHSLLAEHQKFILHVASVNLLYNIHLAYAKA